MLAALSGNFVVTKIKKPYSITEFDSINDNLYNTVIDFVAFQFKRVQFVE